MAGDTVVSMDQYWNYVATPLFLIILAFGVYVLFRVSSTQLVGAAPIATMINALRRGASTSSPTSANATAVSATK